ncbi:unnamed protein product [Nippostrongylus brasiliensis]|uniref:Glycerate kinase (inferred by orthology to a human protein) n=1 Tax=Nippostrongylus brasiliensis TaxID=27835 RepID=A0A0N4XD71_NIPBR|nr:unnamed protein product [Nippostrongylus brasiliensis]
MRTEALTAFKRCCDAVSPVLCVEKALRLSDDQLIVSSASTLVSLPITKATRFVLTAFGKASVPMALAAEQQLGERDLKLRSRVFYGARNNLPDSDSVAGGLGFLDCLPELTKSSSGGSALFCAPEGVTLAEKLSVIQKLTSNGADIRVLNAFRQKLSAVKGGKVLNFVKQGRVVSLLISDLIDDLTQFIASGPTVPANDSIKETAEAILTSPKWLPLLPDKIKAIIEDSPPPAPPPVEPCNIIIASNRHALNELDGYLTSIGYESHIVALLFGGETTVVLHGKGKGGRCQEMVLSCFTQIASTEVPPSPFLFLAAGTDGQDGPTDAAGALITNEDVMSDAVVEQANECLNTSNSYEFWCGYNYGRNHIKTGPTGTNVMDIQIVLIHFNR